MRILSIDPGISGGLASLEFNARNGDGLPRIVVREVQSMPTMARKKDGTGEAVNYVVLAGEISRLAPEVVVIEQASAVAAPRVAAKGKVQKQFGMGVAGAFNFGVGYGVIIGCCATIPQIYVRPANWKRRLGLPNSRENKDAARTLALQTFPYLGEQLKRKKDVGRAEAILIGYDYLRQLADEPGVDAIPPARLPTPAGYTRELEL